MKIYNADAISVMNTMRPESVDLCITDPPYDVITGGNQNRSDQPTGVLNPDSGPSFTGDNLRGEVCKPKDYMGHLYRVMRDPSHVYIMTNLLNLEETMRQMRLAGFKIHNLLVWRKNNATPNRWYMKNCEFIIMGYKGKAFPIADCGSKMVIDIPSVRDRTHPVEKPVELWAKFIDNSCRTGGTVFDPFCGTGSSGEAAQWRATICDRYIGVELNPEYAAIAAKRLGVVPSVL